MEGEIGMKRTDKHLILIVVSALVLVVITLVVALTRPEPAYREGDTPEGVAHNYLLALQQEDFERAFGYLSPSLDGHPEDADAFREDIRRYSWRFQVNEDTTLSIVSSKISGDEATVTVRETRFVVGDLFESSERVRTFEIELAQKGVDWKIVGAESYFAPCWNTERGCG
jgi:hypothetical protein